MTKLICTTFYSIVFNVLSLHCCSQSLTKLQKQPYIHVDIKTLLKNPGKYVDQVVETEGKLGCSAFHCGLFTYDDSTVCDDSITGHKTTYRNFYSLIIKPNTASKAHYLKLEALSDTTVIIRGVVDTTVNNPPWENCFATLKKAFIIKVKP